MSRSAWKNYGSEIHTHIKSATSAVFASGNPGDVDRLMFISESILSGCDVIATL